MKNKRPLPRLILFVAALLFSGVAGAQIFDPVEWHFSHKKVTDNEYILSFTADMDEGWYIYGTDLEPGGPIPTSIVFDDGDGYELLDGLEYPDPDIKYDPNFDMDIPMFGESVTFEQRVRLLSAEGVTIEGELEYMACDEARCLPPDLRGFYFDLEGAGETEAVAGEVAVEENAEEVPVAEETEEAHLEPTYDLDDPETEDTPTEDAEPRTIYSPDDEDEREGLGWTFVVGFLGGLLALLTPCVFPMIPLTVSFFLKNADHKARALRDAFLYGFTIIFSYVVLGLAISMIFGPATLNAAATSPGFNIFFFALLVFFAASFFGAFELTMPAKWSNSLDSKADKTGGLIGVFLMGLTFVLVSFSCTGPIVGTLLVEAAVGGGLFAPTLGMLGFSLALAIPFSLFAVFPTALKSLPKSGGWMNAVKVILGFVVLAFSLKFLSVADAVGQWGILDREIYLALWIAIFSLMGLYLIGKIKFAHDSELNYLSVPRLVLAIVTFAFVFYLIPGLWGAPLTGISSFLPSPVSQDFDLTRTPAHAPAGDDNTIYVGENVQEGPHDLMAFTDYEEGLEAAREADKPIFIDFTGLGCSNCRKMEASVWSDPRVQERLRNDFVKISLYVDDRTRLPEEERFTSDALGRERQIRTIGQKWSAFQAERYGANTQPYYVILDHEENMLAPAYGYDTNVEKYIEFLDEGKGNF
ncbi:MAG: cytochrome c biogenesis protein CcdA [Bacteroidales bacterium]